MTDKKDDTPEKRGCFGRAGCIVLLFTAILVSVTVYLVCIYTPPLRISEETTRITEPLTPDGQIDFFKILEQRVYPPEMTTDDNGFRLFLRTFGDVGGSEVKDASAREFYRQQKYRKLGLDPSIAPTLTMPPEPHAIIKDYPLSRTLNSPWTLEELPMMTDWVAEIDAPLDALADMLEKPVFRAPYLESPNQPQTIITMLLPDVQMFRHLARSFQARANYRIAQGNIDGAVDDTIALYRLGRKAGYNGAFIEMIVGVAIEGVAAAVPFGADPEHPPTEEQLKRLEAAIASLPDRPSVESLFETERLYGLDAMQFCFRNREFGYDSDKNKSMAFNLIGRTANPNVAFRHLNDAYDCLTGKRNRADLGQWIDYSSLYTLKNAGALLTPAGRGKILARIFCSLLLGSADMFEKALRRTECSYNLKRLTLALLLYKTEHGNFPREDWIEQIKPYLSEEPQKFFLCPSSDIEEGKTHYAMILYDSEPASPDTLLLVELREPVPLNEAFLTVDEFLDEVGKSKGKVGSAHPGGLNVAQRNGAVQFYSNTTRPEEYRPLVDREP